MRESEIQKAIVDYVRICAPLVLIYAIPNASRRTVGGRAGNAVPGLTAGIPDLGLVLPVSRAAFLEVKTDKGRISPAQEAMRLKMIRLGVLHAIVRGVDDVRDTFALWGVKTREAT